MKPMTVMQMLDRTTEKYSDCVRGDDDDDYRYGTAMSALGLQAKDERMAYDDMG